jgi:hypothetical protein
MVNDNHGQRNETGSRAMPPATSLEGIMSYAIASGLVGFPLESLRVRVIGTQVGVVFVVTADLIDAGTHLVLDPDQLRAIEPEVDLVYSQGLVRLCRP